MNNKKLFLDDLRIPSDVFHYIKNEIYLNNNNWFIVKNYLEFIVFIEINYIETNSLPNTISFDHDLALEHYRPSMYDNDNHYSKYYIDGTFKEKTGYDCAKWLIDFIIDNKIEELPTILVHSMNPVGKENIISLFNSF
jgi:hypothetical protein